ncbi:MAG: CBS domain-containing protein [Anaerolineae bacterium]|nr:CBS domain-containing protein [Anaerolineae bacterium]
MATVRDMLKTKGLRVWSVTPDTTVYDALKLMAEKNIGAVLVMEADKVMGILSERDYARKIILLGRASADTPAREIMTERVMCVGPEETAEQCMALMTEKKVRHLPVLENNQLIGIISIGDVVKATIAQKEFIIEQLEEYIRGTPYVPPEAANTG